MTQAQQVTIVCPQCQSEQGVPMSDGTRLCLSCRNEWDPSRPQLVAQAPTPPAPAPMSPPEDNDATTRAAVPPGAPPTVDDVLGPPAEVLAEREAQARLDAMVGTQVVLEGGQVATIVGFPDDDHVEVSFAGEVDGFDGAVVDFNDVVRSIDAPPPVADVDDETAHGLAAVNMTIAGLVLRAGVASIAGEYPNAELLTPPSGWLDLDPDMIPALEQGCAYAVAFLIHAYSIDREVIEQMADMLINDAQSVQQTLKGGQE